MSRGTSAILVTVVMLAAGARSPIRAQGGFIRGIVQDSATGDVLPYVEVRVATDCWDYITFTDKHGNFTTRPLPAWTYELTARTPGYRPSEPSTITVAAGDTARLDLLLAGEDATRRPPLLPKPSPRPPPAFDAADSVPNPSCPSGVEATIWRFLAGVWRHIGQCRDDRSWWAWEPDRNWFPLRCPPRWGGPYQRVLQPGGATGRPLTRVEDSVTDSLTHVRTRQQIPCPTLAVMPFQFTGYGRVPILRAQAESVTAALNQALGADTSVCWLPARAEERPRPPGGLPPAVRYVVSGSIAARGPDTTFILWRLIEVPTNQQLLVDSLSVQEPNWQRRIVRSIGEAVAGR